MDITTIDFESFWSATHTLTKMLPIAYCMHPDTEIQSCSIKLNNDPTLVFFGFDAIAGAFKMLTPQIEGGMLVAHNMSGFDAMIASWRFGLKPRLWACTLAMARPKYGKTVGLSLSKLVQHFGIGVKNDAILHQTKGRRLSEFTHEELDAMRTYNKADTDQCRALFDILIAETNSYEMWQIDSLVRGLVEPAFVLDTALLESALVRERIRKRKSLISLAQHLNLAVDTADEDATADAVRDVLMSAAKFSQLLTDQGVDIPMKVSPSDPDEVKMIPALAKTDEGFIALQEDDNPVVAAAAMARLGAKSTLLETRIESFLLAGSHCGGRLPIPTRYYGGHTGRDSGEQYNPQNLPRIGRDHEGKIKGKLTNALRLSLTAPPGYVVIVADLSGIELRVNHFLWQVTRTMKLFRDKPDADLYRAEGAVAHGCTPEEVTKDQRQVEKIKALGLGFGAGGATFRTVARTMGGLRLTPEESTKHVYDWRNQNREIVDGWGDCDSALPYIQAGKVWPIDMWGLLKTSPEGIVMAGRRTIRYPNLRQEVQLKGPRAGQTQWVYGDGQHKKNIYGGKIDENVVQGLGAMVMMDALLEFYKQTRDKSTGFAGWRPALRVHDEGVYVVPETQAEALLARLQAILRTPPTFWPDLITWSEGDIARSYGLAK